jgi:hypothetical protein
MWNNHSLLFSVFYLITKKYVGSAKGEVTRFMQIERFTQEKREASLKR